MKEEHFRHVHLCRRVYTEHKVAGRTQSAVASAAMDAAAQALHRLPITASRHPKLVGMEKLQLKITGPFVVVQFEVEAEHEILAPRRIGTIQERK